MKTLKLLSGFAIMALMLTSCYTEVVVQDDYVDEVPYVNLSTVLNSHELWYVDIDRSYGAGDIPFLQKAFTVSFANGNLFANNNLVGIGSQGNGFGIDVGYYDTFEYDYILDVSHDLDGFYSFEVTQLSYNEIKLYYRPGNITYILVGYDRATFDYDRLFYDNIHYFMQEYVAWEKVFTSDYGAVNEFDYENFLQFIPGGGEDNFRSSQDLVGTDIDLLFWDYVGIYNVNDVAGNDYLKRLTLSYDYLGNEFFELSVINDNTIELYHPDSGTLYRFKGRGYIQYKRTETKRESKATIAKQLKKIEKV
jgi:hypothetical protein